MGTETHLNQTITDRMISENYDLYRTDRNCFGGGTIIGIRNVLRSRLITGFVTHNFETVFYEVNMKYLFCCIYIRPNPNFSHILEFESMIK